MFHFVKQAVLSFAKGGWHVTLESSTDSSKSLTSIGDCQINRLARKGPFRSVNGLMVRILPFQGRGPGSIPG